VILAGDIGGTKSRLALFTLEGQHPKLLTRQTYKSRDYSGVEAPLVAACLGVACPIAEERCRTPNLPWVIDAAVIRETVGLEKVQLINDLEANGLGIPFLSDDEFVTLQEGTP
jgi:glucokinase